MKISISRKRALSPLENPEDRVPWFQFGPHKQDAKIYLVTPTVAANLPTTPLPPTVEEAYRRKCIDLKKRMNEVEESNDAFRLRKTRLNRGICKMRLERAYLLEMLSKRMKKNGASNDEASGYEHEDSEGSSEGPVVLQDRPLRPKRGQRRSGGSPSTTVEQTQPARQPAYPYDHQSQPQHESPYGPALRSNGAKPPPKSQPSPVSLQPSTSDFPGPSGKPPSAPGHAPQAFANTVADFDNRPAKPATSMPPTHNPMLSPIPAPEPFAMFFENNYLSQPHKHAGARTESDLHELAQKHWVDPNFASQRRMYENQAEKQRGRYEAMREMDLSAQQQQQQQLMEVQPRSIQPTVEGGETDPGPPIAKSKVVDGEDIEVANGGSADGATSAGGFATINY